MALSITIRRKQFYLKKKIQLSKFKQVAAISSSSKTTAKWLGSFQKLLPKLAFRPKMAVVLLVLPWALNFIRFSRRCGLTRMIAGSPTVVNRNIFLLDVNGSITICSPWVTKVTEK